MDAIEAVERDDSTQSSHSKRDSKSDTSWRSDTTWRYSVFGPDRLGKGAMLFTGPDGIRDQRVQVEEDHHFVGEGSMSPEGSSDVDYLWRAPVHIPHPRPKSALVGEVGWGIPQYMDWSAAISGAHMRLGTFRQQAEDRHTHLFQNPWYPSPRQTTSSSRGRRQAPLSSRYRYQDENEERALNYSGHRYSNNIRF